MSNFFFILGELKSFAEYLPEERRAEYKEKLENAKEAGFLLWDKKEKAEQERDELKRKNDKNILSRCFAFILMANFLLFPLINFIARCIDPNAPQISFEMEKLVRIFIPFVGAG